MASSLITITVKLLNGDLISLEIYPASGLDGVKRKLEEIDFEQFPFYRTKIMFSDESQTELINNTLLYVFIDDIKMCRLISVENKILGGTNASYEFNVRHWNFILENGRPMNVFRTLLSPKMKSGSRPRYSIVAYPSSDLPHYFRYDTISDALFWKKRCNVSPITMRDAYVINLAVEKYEDYEITKNNEFYQENEILCECGYILKRGSLKSHLKTKRHMVGDIEMKEFMSLAKQQIESFQSESN